MQDPPSIAPEGLPPLTSYPFQVTLPARFGDVAPGGAIEHVGMARCYEDARGAFMDHVAAQAGLDRAQLHSFIVRAVNEQWAPVTYPGSITVGAATIAVGGSSFTVEMATFQEDVCVGRSRALAVSIGPDHAPAPLSEGLRAAWMAGFCARPSWTAPPKPAAERRQPASYPHQLTLQTRFSDTDLIGHLNNVSLLRYCDEGRGAALLDAAALLDTHSAAGVQAAGMVVSADISYLQEVRLPHPLTVATAIRGVEGRQVRLEQALFHEEACVVVCDCLVLVSEALARHLRSQLPGA